MAKKGIGNRIGIVVGIVILLIVIAVVPVSSEKIDIQCFTTPCNPIIESKTILDILIEQSEPEQIACIEIFAPVCGVDGVTYSNQCKADVKNVMVIHDGECTGDEGMIISDSQKVLCQIYPTASGCN